MNLPQLGWDDRAACVPHPALFFAPDRETLGARQRRIKKAKAICGNCPVIDSCKSYALKHYEPFGVWGGMDETERMRANPLIHPSPISVAAPMQLGTVAPSPI